MWFHCVDQLTKFILNATGERFCMLSNSDNTGDYTADLGEDGKFFVPAWSVTFLQNCSKEVYNTAKVAVNRSSNKIFLYSLLKTWNRKCSFMLNYFYPQINTQTSVMVTKHSEEDAYGNEVKPAKFSWMWAPEPIQDTLKGNGRFEAAQLLDQKEASGDVSDYLWYMTR